MRFLVHPYYVGFLSAAQLHGASHQAPMVFQIVTPAVMRDRRVGRSSLQFIRREANQQRAVTTVVPRARFIAAKKQDRVSSRVEREQRPQRTALRSPQLLHRLMSRRIGPGQPTDGRDRFLGQRWSSATLSIVERSADGKRIRQFSADDLVALSRAFLVHARLPRGPIKATGES